MESWLKKAVSLFEGDATDDDDDFRTTVETIGHHHNGTATESPAPMVEMQQEVFPADSPCVCYVLQHGMGGDPADWDLWREHIRAAHAARLPHTRICILQPENNGRHTADLFYRHTLYQTRLRVN